MNIHIVQSGKGWDLAALTPPEVLRIAGVPRRPPRRRAQLVIDTQAAAELGRHLQGCDAVFVGPLLVS